MRLIQDGNRKLHNTFMFNIPATKEICGRICPGCYAEREQNRFPVILKARLERYEASLLPSFVETVNKEISRTKKPFQFFRIHASGEFYSQEYINKWVQIAKANPTKIFYAYTKRLKDFDFSALKSLQNTVIIDSLHHGTLNYGKQDQAPEQAFVCPYHIGAICGQTCTYCMTKQAETTGVYFIKH